MTIKDKIDPFIKYESRERSVRHKYIDINIEDVLLPSIGEYINKLKTQKGFENSLDFNYVNDSNLEILINKSQMPSSYNAFSNFSSSLSWVINDLTIASDLINENFLKKLDKLVGNWNIEFVEKGINNEIINEQLLKYKNIKDEYLKDPLILQTLESLDSFKNAIIELEYIIKKVTPEIKKTVNVKDGIIHDPSIESNTLLNPIKETIDLYYEEIIPYLEKDRKFVDFSQIYNYLPEFDNILRTLNKEFNKYGYGTCMADNYILNEQNNDSITAFLDKKNKDINIKEEIYFENANYQKSIIFSDNSIVFKDNKNNYVNPLNNNELFSIIEDIIKSDIQYRFKKNPTLQKRFLSINESKKQLSNYRYLDTLMNTFIENENILKVQKFNTFEFLSSFTGEQNKGFSNNIEKTEDKIHAVVKEHKIKQYAHSIASNKYFHLYNEESYKLISTIYDLKIENSQFQDYVGKKIASYKTPEIFNAALHQFIRSFDNFTIEKILEAASLHTTPVISQDNNIVILEILDYYQSQALGSSSWCIAREENYFESYLDNGNKQYFIYNLNKFSNENDSMIGITLDKNGDYSTAHLKDDSHIKGDNEFISSIINKINEKKPVLKVTNSRYSI